MGIFWPIQSDHYFGVGGYRVWWGYSLAGLGPWVFGLGQL